MTGPRVDGAITLRDGRTLAYAELGDPSGHPVLYFHGSPSSRLEPLMIGDETLRSHRLRVVAPDRPGMGGSDFVRGRRMTDWPADAAALADGLGLDRFSILGNSGGGPYVAACASRIPERLLSAVIVSGGWRMDWPEARAGLPLPNRVAMFLAKRAPILLQLLLTAMGSVKEATRRRSWRSSRSACRRPTVAAFRAARPPRRLRSHDAGMHAPGSEGRDLGHAAVRARLSDSVRKRSSCPVSWFHGEADTNAPIALARGPLASLPGVRS
jgi:pimeloyl-ACP methyl ester carboxylesterase